MNVYQAIIVFVTAWWVVFFILLPIGLRTHAEHGEEAGVGHEASAPIKTYLGRKILATTLISLAILGLIYWVEVNDLISLRPDFHRH